MKKLNVLAIAAVMGILLLFSCQSSVKKGLTLNSLFSEINASDGTNDVHKRKCASATSKCDLSAVQIRLQTSADRSQ